MRSRSAALAAHGSALALARAPASKPERHQPNRARSASVRYALSNSFGFGGTNGSLLFKRLDGFCYVYPGVRLSHVYGISAGRGADRGHAGTGALGQPVLAEILAGLNGGHNYLLPARRCQDHFNLPLDYNVEPARFLARLDNG